LEMLSKVRLRDLLFFPVNQRLQTMAELPNIDDRKRRLDGKVALVIGAGSSGPGWGTGKATAVHLSRMGAQVVGMDLKLSAADETGSIILGEGGAFASVGGDATDPEGARNAVTACIKEFGRLDILVNNLGISHFGGLANTALADWERIFRTNVTSAFLMCKEAVPKMLEVGGGSIINISSLASSRWTKPLTAYASSKAAMNQLTQYIALEYASKGIRANAILPGMILTPMVIKPIESRIFGSDLDAEVKKRDAICPTGKMGNAWDIAFAAGFLASDEARYINGVLLPVDGGLSCQVCPP
jgi:NAD(P)-dependent dehydrogenase (short-subunit alcohol dehydrogenase family)